MIRFGICDDDFEFAEKFKDDILDYCDKKFEGRYEIECVCYNNAQDAIDNFRKDSIDVYFLDIEFGDVSGMDIARRLEKLSTDFGCVYVTNYEHYASKAFVCRPLGFIRKMYIEDDIGMVIASVFEYLERDKRLFIFMDNLREIPARLGNVQYIQMYGHNMMLALIDKEFRIRDQLSRVEDLLCEQGFIKINRSCIVNLKFIEDVRDTDIIMMNQKVLHTSAERRRDIFIKWQHYKMNY